MKLSEIERNLFRRMGRIGGKRRMETMTKEERKASAKKAVNARWKKAKAAKAA